MDPHYVALLVDFGKIYNAVNLPKVGTSNAVKFWGMSVKNVKLPTFYFAS